MFFCGNAILWTRYFEDKEEEAKQDFFNELKSLYEKTKIQQDNGQKEAITYLTIAYLRSSILTGSNQFMISMYSDKFYLDETESNIYWTPKFMFEHIENDMRETKDFIIKSEKIARLSEFEMGEVRYYYTEAHFPVIALFMKKLVDICIDEIKQSSLVKPIFNENFSVVYGGYMEEGLTIYPVNVDEM
jgi:hypothetical protein